MSSAPAMAAPLRAVGRGKPPPPPLCAVPPPGVFVLPHRRIVAPADLAAWLKSPAYSYYMRFVTEVNSAVRSRGRTSPSDAEPPHGSIGALVELLDRLNAIVDQCPPETCAQRYGNKAFRTWHALVLQQLDDLLAPVLSCCGVPCAATVELRAYLSDSFGNATRIDYGTGHEACFAMFLCSLYILRAFDTEQLADVALCVFVKYMWLVRRLQSLYQMEPAGSQGVWSLDDHQFLPFIWGSAQLLNDGSLMPRHMLDGDVVQRYADDNMLFACIRHINEVKTGPFAEHSNQLWNISGVPSWNKVNQGLFKMYNAEVLGKFPVVQHFVFGKLLPFDNDE